MPAPDTLPIILVYGRHQASISLYFEGLPEHIQNHFHIREPASLDADLPYLISASLVIIVREFQSALVSGVIDLLEHVDVPFVWFTDDDLIALQQEQASFNFYTMKRVQKFTEKCAAVLVTTATLQQTYGTLHSTILLWPCVYQNALRSARVPHAKNQFHVGAYAGGFRSTSFTQNVWPAIQALPDRLNIKTFATSALCENVNSTKLIRVPFIPKFESFISAWQRFNLSAIVHPYGSTLNIANKSHGSILIAAYLGAVPIIGDEPANHALNEADGILKAAPHATSWRNALSRLLDPQERKILHQQLHHWCTRHYAPENACAPFNALIKLAVCNNAATQAIRLRALRNSFLRRLHYTKLSVRLAARLVSI